MHRLLAILAGVGWIVSANPRLLETAEAAGPEPCCCCVSASTCGCGCAASQGSAPDPAVDDCLCDEAPPALPASSPRGPEQPRSGSILSVDASCTAALSEHPMALARCRAGPAPPALAHLQTVILLI